MTEKDNVAHKQTVQEIERERDRLAYKLVLAQEEYDKLDAALDRFGPMMDEARALLGPISGIENWQQVPFLNVVRGAVNEYKVKDGALTECSRQLAEAIANGR